jgi:riboflavin synthase
MFTGLIEAICRVSSARRSGDGMVLSVDLGSLAEGGKTGSTSSLQVGDSIAINGACLTVTEIRGSVAGFDVSGETLARTTLGRLRPVSEVNVERAMKADGRFGGHFVAGHIDGVATIKSIKGAGQFADMRFAANAELLGQMVVKGSVAVDGISLTIAGMDESGFSVALIPETLKKTTLGKVKIGDKVNIEIDIIAKMIKKQLEKILPKEHLTVERLKELGF